jgi:hypothetical protein
MVKLREEKEIVVDKSTLSKFLIESAFTLKVCEKQSIHRTLTRIIQRRTQFKTLIMQFTNYYNHIVYLDESSFNKSIINRKHGRAPIGEKALNKKIITPRKEFRCTLQAAICGNHCVHHKIVETPGYGANAIHFRVFLIELLAKMPNNGVLILDNAAIHRTETIRVILHNAFGSRNIRTIYTAPYSPIEIFFNVLKTKLKDAQINVNTPRLFFNDVSRCIRSINRTSYSGFYSHTLKRIIDDQP